MLSAVARLAAASAAVSPTLLPKQALSDDAPTDGFQGKKVAASAHTMAMTEAYG